MNFGKCFVLMIIQLWICKVALAGDPLNLKLLPHPQEISMDGIIDNNLKKKISHSYDLEVFRTIAQLIQHTAETYIDFSNVEKTLAQANRLHYEDHQAAYDQLTKIIGVLEINIERRQRIFSELVSCWEKTRLVKGMATNDKKYFFQRDRARHFANRQPDMSYLIYDEAKLGIESYLEKIRSYSANYKQTYLLH